MGWIHSVSDIGEGCWEQGLAAASGRLGESARSVGHDEVMGMKKAGRTSAILVKHGHFF